VDHAGWVVQQALRPVRETFGRPTLEAALAWCLVWLLRDDISEGTAG